MENISQQAPIPLEQAIIPFHGRQIIAVRLPDNRIAVTLNSLCALVGILPHGQVRRIKRDEDLAEHLLLIRVETAGGPQRAAILIAEAIPFWVVKLHVDQIAPEQRGFIVFLKMEAAEVLYRHFFGSQSAQPTPELEAASLHPPSRSGSDMVADSPRERLFGAIRDFLEEEQVRIEKLEHTQREQTEQIAFHEEWLTSLDRRVADAGQGSAAGLGWIPLLSASHLNDMRVLLRSLEQAAGRTQAQLEQEMLEAFRVPAVNAIPGELWEDVLAWGLWRARQPR